MLVQYAMQNSKKDLLPFKSEVYFFKEQCPKTLQEIEDTRRIFYASTMGYIDSDIQANKDFRKSTLGSVFTLNWGAVI
ncbi:gag/pol protein [Cucumis melo var. makuwa]|uniref:Gag/pol protein n=1 Tax=Cucumis melo var. makuwa TaxID=1194695 RepID=A0A5A7TYU1_CUCMM|nr:gag/pol protein [Cucumis melo var. makuwa]